MLKKLFLALALVVTPAVAADKPVLPPECIYQSEIMDHIHQMFPGATYTVSQAVPTEQAGAFWSYLQTHMTNNVNAPHLKGVVGVLRIDASDGDRSATLFASLQKTKISEELVSCGLDIINPVDNDRLMQGFEENSI